MTKDEALKIRQILDNPDLSNFVRMWEVSLFVDEALEQPAQEPYKIQFPTMLRQMWSGGMVQDWINKLPPLYTHPHQWQRLTDDEIETIWISMDKCSQGNLYNDFDFARAIEAKLKEKNT